MIIVKELRNAIIVKGPDGKRQKYVLEATPPPRQNPDGVKATKPKNVAKLKKVDKPKKTIQPNVAGMPKCHDVVQKLSMQQINALLDDDKRESASKYFFILLCDT